MSVEQSRYNQFLEAEFGKEGKHIIAVGEVLTQETWDTIIKCVNVAVDEYVEDLIQDNKDEYQDEDKNYNKITISFDTKEDIRFEGELYKEFSETFTAFVKVCEKAGINTYHIKGNNKLILNQKLIDVKQ